MKVAGCMYIDSAKVMKPELQNHAILIHLLNKYGITASDYYEAFYNNMPTQQRIKYVKLCRDEMDEQMMEILEYVEQHYQRKPNAETL